MARPRVRSPWLVCTLSVATWGMRVSKAKSNERTRDTDASEKPTCFVLMPISDRDGYQPGHFDKVYQDILKPSIEEAGFMPVRADESAGTSLIQYEVVRQLYRADMALCDISATNSNVFYELGFRHAFDKSTVIVKDERTKEPFDIHGIRYCSYESSLEYRSVLQARKEISRAILET